MVKHDGEEMGDVTEEDFQRRLRAIRRLIARRQLPKPANDPTSGPPPTTSRAAVSCSRNPADKPTG